MRRGGHLPEDGASGDPLAELARLIGQSDPFSDYGRREGRNPPPRDAQPQAGSDWRRQAAAMPPYDAPEEAPPRAPSRSEPRFTESYSSRDPYRAAEERQDTRDMRQEPHADPRYEPRYEERSSQYRREPQYEDDGYDDRRHDDPRQDDRMYGARDERSQPGYFDDGAPLDEDEDAYDDPPRSSRRGGLFTAVTLIGCAMIGTAGAYGYRTYYSSPGSNRVPPVISADTTPTKVVAAAEGPSGKSIKDRVGDTAERVIPREEEPVELRTPSSSRGFPQSGFPSGGSSGANAFAAPPSGNANSGGGESKRVRTLTIRPEEATGRTANNAPPSTASSSATPPRPTPVPKTASRNSPPISLDAQEPAAPPAPREAPAPRERTAVVAPPPSQNLQPPAPRAPVSEGSASGYAVQLSSQRSEAEAQASYRSLQSKYPDQLSDRSVMIKRVDLGTKGVYYRAMVGPFGSSDEASQFCSDLKAAGGQCLIQRN